MYTKPIGGIFAVQCATIRERRSWEKAPFGRIWRDSWGAFVRLRNVYDDGTFRKSLILFNLPRMRQDLSSIFTVRFRSLLQEDTKSATLLQICTCLHRFKRPKVSGYCPVCRVPNEDNCA
jgi:hypothetical protein